MAIPLATVKESNNKLELLDEGQVGVFVGGTAGIGEFTLKAFAAKARKPKIYIVGRNETAASAITAAVDTINTAAQVVFIKADTSLLANVDVACKEIKSKETAVNFLFLTTGYLSFEGRNETSEGLDKRLCLNYYSRMRFVYNLLPELTTASKSSNALSRVVTVLTAGHEGPIVEDDLGLEREYSFSKCRSHGSVMNDFACEELAKQNPGTAFVHVFPGFVRTGIMNHGGMVLKILGKVLMAVVSPWEVSAEESGERNLFLGTAEMFGPSDGAKGEDAKTGSDGRKGSGAYLANWDGNIVGAKKVLDPLRERGVGGKIWEHTLEVFERTERDRGPVKAGET